MAELTIDFVYMFLLVTDSKRPVVLLPNGMPNYPHETEVWDATKLGAAAARVAQRVRKANQAAQQIPSIDMTDLSIFWVRPTDQAHIQLDGDETTSFPDPNMLLHLGNVRSPGSPAAHARVNGELLRENRCPEVLNARFWLPRGQFRALGAVNPMASTARWDIRRPDNSIRRQYLSDHMQFVCTIDPNLDYVLHTWDRNSTAAPKATLLNKHPKTGNIRLFVLNDDTTGNVPIDLGKLDDYIEIYKLANGPITDWNVPETVWPPVSQVSAKLRNTLNFTPLSNQRPICGGGQGCPDPPDPDMPCQ